MNSGAIGLDCWCIGDTPFTSGSINKDCSMYYHRDRGNVPNTGSVMWLARSYCKGGHLHIPELGLLVDCSHGAMVAFYGETFWHGVTQITGLSRAKSVRLSIVAYSKRAILYAQEGDDEHLEAAKRSTAAFDEVRDTATRH